MQKTISAIARWFPFSWRDFFIAAGILCCAAGLCLPLQSAGTSDGFASPIFVLAVNFFGDGLRDVLDPKQQ